MKEKERGGGSRSTGVGSSDSSWPLASSTWLLFTATQMQPYQSHFCNVRSLFHWLVSSCLGTTWLVDTCWWFQSWKFLNFALDLLQLDLLQCTQPTIPFCNRWCHPRQSLLRRMQMTQAKHTCECAVPVVWWCMWSFCLSKSWENQSVWRWSHSLTLNTPTLLQTLLWCVFHVVLTTIPNY